MVAYGRAGEKPGERAFETGKLRRSDDDLRSHELRVVSFYHFY